VIGMYRPPMPDGNCNGSVTTRALGDAEELAGLPGGAVCEACAADHE
jgi:hypothetical protein